MSHPVTEAERRVQSFPKNAPHTQGGRFQAPSPGGGVHASHTLAFIYLAGSGPLFGIPPAAVDPSLSPITASDSRIRSLRIRFDSGLISPQTTRRNTKTPVGRRGFVAVKPSVSERLAKVFVRPWRSEP